jgi:hypothetical protein
VRAVNHTSNEVQRKVKEDRKKRKFERRARQDRGEDVSDTDKEDEAKEREIGDDDDERGVAWDALVEEDEPAGGDPS